MSGHRGTNASLALLLALAAGQAAAAPGARPLQLGFEAPPARQALANARMQRQALAERQAGARAPSIARLPQAAPAGAAGLGRRAVQSLLADPEPALEAPRDPGRMQLKFQRRGNGLRDFQRSYNDMCNRVSGRIWDDPNGKRIRFDIAGKPGLAVEIPLR